MDYKEMYLKMMRASEEAIRILIQAQQECEEMYVSAQETELIVLRPDGKQGTCKIRPRQQVFPVARSICCVMPPARNRCRQALLR